MKKQIERNKRARGNSNFMKNLSISMKLIVGFGIVLLLMLATIVMSVLSMNGINAQINAYAQYTLPNNTSLWVIRRNTVSIQRYLAQALAETDAQDIEGFLDSAQQDAEALLAELDTYAANQRDTSRDQKLAELSDLYAKAGATRREINKLLQSPTGQNRAQATVLFENEYVPVMDRATDILVDFTATADARAAQQKLDAEAAANTAWIILIACGVAAVALTVVITLIIRKSILTPVREIVDVFGEISKGNMKSEIRYESRDELGQMARLIKESNQMQSAILRDVMEKFGLIARGDLRISVDIEYPGDFKALKISIEDMVANLNHTMQTINTAAEQVSTGAAQVASGAQALASGSTEQASSVEELSESVSKIADQAAENSENVKIATQYVEQAGSGVTAGNEHMKRLTEAMADIDSSSGQIANITKVIEDIAFQTNILALNAAIEAARAGNAGKGFAVVADEVRSLAAKSAEAAKQTAELIQASVATVQEGTQITEQTAQILQDVGQKAARAVESIEKIEAASAEQAAAIEQIKQGLNQVSAVVQTNAATAEENSATSEEMSAQAATLREEVGRFKLNDGYVRDRASAISLVSEYPEEDLGALPAAAGMGKYGGKPGAGPDRERRRQSADNRTEKGRRIP
jgi:methyl-accepting chemotaxis protein